MCEGGVVDKGGNSLRSASQQVKRLIGLESESQKFPETASKLG